MDRFNHFVRTMHQSIMGITKGFKKKIKIVGVGYKAFLEQTAVQEKRLKITLGYSHKNYIPLDRAMEVRFGRKNNRMHLMGPS